MPRLLCFGCPPTVSVKPTCGVLVVFKLDGCNSKAPWVPGSQKLPQDCLNGRIPIMFCCFFVFVSKATAISKPNRYLVSKSLPKTAMMTRSGRSNGKIPVLCNVVYECLWPVWCRLWNNYMASNGCPGISPTINRTAQKIAYQCCVVGDCWTSDTISKV